MRSFRFWLRILSGTLAALCMTAAHAQSLMDRPISEVQAALDKILECTTWEGTAKSPGCVPKRTGYSTGLDQDSADGTVETIETGGVLEWGDNRIPNQGIYTRRALHKVFDYLFPRWPERSAWLDMALCNVMAGKRSIKKLGKLTILVEPELPADLPLIAAGVFVTKRSSVDQWTVSDTKTAPKGRCAQRMPPRR